MLMGGNVSLVRECLVGVREVRYSKERMYGKEQVFDIEMRIAARGGNAG
jgi:hypothetical protein